MTSLPVLVKKPNGVYTVGADVSTDRRGELFSFCVMETLPNDKFSYIVQQGQVINEKKGDWKAQVESLNEFYNTKTLIEKR